MWENIKEWGTLIIAMVALIQPWLITAWKKFILKGIIYIHETGSLEIGYSNFGETIGLHGTLLAANKDQFISNMELKIVKLKDNSNHLLEWGVFRSTKLTISPSKEASFELPSGFLITMNQPYKYNIQFHDKKIQNEMRPFLIQLRDNYNKTVAPEIRKQYDGMNQKLEATEHLQIFHKFFSEFIKTDIAIRTHSKIERLLYWEPGEYLIELKVLTMRPEQIFTKKWKFNLTEDEYELLRQNNIMIIIEACGQPPGEFNFAYVKYEGAAN